MAKHFPNGLLIQRSKDDPKWYSWPYKQMQPRAKIQLIYKRFWGNGHLQGGWTIDQKIYLLFVNISNWYNVLKSNIQKKILGICIYILKYILKFLTPLHNSTVLAHWVWRINNTHFKCNIWKLEKLKGFNKLADERKLVHLLLEAAQPKLRENSKVRQGATDSFAHFLINVPMRCTKHFVQCSNE